MLNLITDMKFLNKIAPRSDYLDECDHDGRRKCERWLKNDVKTEWELKWKTFEYESACFFWKNNIFTFFPSRNSKTLSFYWITRNSQWKQMKCGPLNYDIIDEVTIILYGKRKLSTLNSKVEISSCWNSQHRIYYSGFEYQFNVFSHMKSRETWLQMLAGGVRKFKHSTKPIVWRRHWKLQIP